MKETSNYKLSQWDEEDRILREDFNGDNGKIDAAIQAANNRVTAETSARQSAISAEATARAAAVSRRLEFVEIGTFTGTLDSGTGKLSIPTPGVRWGDYVALELTIQVPPFTGGGCTLNLGGGGRYAAFDSSGSIGGGVSPVNSPNSQYIFFPMKNPDAQILCFMLGTMCAGTSNATFGSITGVTFSPSSGHTVPPVFTNGSCTIKLRGVK